MKFFIILTTSVVVLCGSVVASGQGADPDHYAVPCNRTIHADVVSLDQVIWYNRFGAVDPYGMIFALASDVVPRQPGTTIAPGNVRLKNNKRPRPLVLRANVGDCLEITITNLLSPTPSSLGSNDRTRTVGFHVNGLEVTSPSHSGLAMGSNGPAPLAAQQTATYRYYCSQEGQFLFNSPASSIGGEGGHGAISHGLFGAVTVQPEGSTWYRSQVSDDVLASVTLGVNPNGTPQIDYNAVDAGGKPLLRLLDDNNNLVHSDLTATVVPGGEDCLGSAPSGTCGDPYREFVIIFHDEIGITQAYPVLQQDKLYAGIRDAFAINYGTAGLGAPVIANRMGEGPGKDCGECKFEEFFLESWVNGDPSMPIVRNPISGIVESAAFEDDPSNVYHSYMNDAVRIRNLHIGSETHVFHLHAHQWLFEPRNPNSTYLDSQSIAPGNSFTYEINYNGSGNRNKTVGDSIFHCHLYPHFAEGMWSLWRTHDVFEDGTSSRNLPDAEIAQGTPVPAIVPLPGKAMPPMPTSQLPGFPHFLPGVAGHRVSQPPLEMIHDGGLQRHRVGESTFDTGDLAVEPHYQADEVFQRVKANNPHFAKTGYAKCLETAELILLPAEGTPSEQAAMDFHAGLTGTDAVDVTDQHGWPGKGYPSFDSAGNPGVFVVNGLAPQAGAPYADPCPPQFVDGNGLLRDVGTRTYKAAYIQFDMTINELGWHNRQARIAVLNEDVMPTLNGTRSPEPLFFRANSGECIVFESTNLMPNALNLDDFQIFTPTDIIGQHIHLVKFDVTSSDGSANGWNYEDGTFAPEEVRERIHANNAWQIANNAGAQILTEEVHPVFGAGPNDAWVGAQTTVQRWWADPLVNNQGEDRTIRSVFTHDHFGPSSHQQHGLYALLVVEPTDSIWTYPNGNTLLGTRDDGGPTTWAANILAGVQGADSMREFVFETGEWMPAYDGANNPINAPMSQLQNQTLVDGEDTWPNMAGRNSPEAISMGGGVMTINYRNDPPTRGEAGSVAPQAFESGLYGDPFTPLAEAYEGDKIKISMAHGAQEEFHTFTVTGNRWLQEGSNPNSGFTNSQFYGISEHFEAYFTLGDGLRHATGSQGVTDYSYHYSEEEGMRGGIWGILRGHSDPTPGLAHLPNNTNTTSRPQHPLQFGICPTGPGSPPIRQFHIQAWRAADLVGGAGLMYNSKFEVFDPNGMVFIHAEDMIPIMTGQRILDPLVMRAAAGECMEVTLTNMMPAAIDPGIGVPRANGFESIQTTVGLSPQLVAHDMGSGSSTNFGNNASSLVGPGDSMQYAWYAGVIHGQDDGSIQYEPVEFGMTNLRSFGDVFAQHKHGLIGSLIIEPEGSQWFYDYLDGNGYVEAISGYEADILDQDGLKLYGEYVLQCQDSFPRLSKGQINNRLDEKQLENLAGYNYATEPLWLRKGVIGTDPAEAMGGQDNSFVYSSTEAMVGCGNLPCLDPATPGCDGEAGDMIMFRIGQAGGLNNGHSFGISGHQFQRQPFTDGSKKIGYNPDSMYIGGTDPITAMNHKNVLFKAGGEARSAGTYMYNMMDSFAQSGGCWGLLQVDPYVRVPALPVADLTCSAIAGTGAQLNWVSGGTDYQTVEIYRNSQLISVMPGTANSYLDEIAVPGNYIYSVVAVNADLPSTEASCNVTIVPPAPGTLACVPSTGEGALLSWENNALYDEVVVIRDGAEVGRLPGTVSTHIDPINPGQYNYLVIGYVNQVDAPSAPCAMALAPSAPQLEAPLLADPCTHTFTINWINTSVTTAIIATLDGVLLETLPGEASSMSVTLDGIGTQQLCLIPVGNDVNGQPACIDIVAEGVATTSPAALSVSVDPATYIATIQWQSTTQMGQYEVTLDGTQVALVPGSETQCSVAVPNSGAFTVCVGGTTICDDTVVASCTEGLAPQRFQRGDTNSNGSVDLGDVVNALNIVFGGSPTLCLDAADTNDDGSVDITDAVSLVNYLFGNGAGPAAPGGECGADLTSDSLDCISSTNCP